MDPDAGGYGRLPDATLAHHADLVVAAQDRLDLRLQLGLPDLVGGRADVDPPEGGLVQRKAPPAVWRYPARRHEFVGPNPIGIGLARRRNRRRLRSVTLGWPGLTRRSTRRRRWRGAMPRGTPVSLGLPAWLLASRGAVGAISGRQGPRVAGRSRWRSVPGWRLTETAARSFRLGEWRRKRFGLATGRAGFGARSRRCPPAGWRRSAVAVFFCRRGRATIRRIEVDGRPRPYRWVGGSGRARLRSRWLEVGLFAARPAEFPPQCVVAVGHCRPP
jgi:hypothetical protein